MTWFCALSSGSSSCVTSLRSAPSSPQEVPAEIARSFPSQFRVTRAEFQTPSVERPSTTALAEFVRTVIAPITPGGPAGPFGLRGLAGPAARSGRREAGPGRSPRAGASGSAPSSRSRRCCGSSGSSPPRTAAGRGRRSSWPSWLTAATLVPPSATRSAMQATTMAGDGRRRACACESPFQLSPCRCLGARLPRRPAVPCLAARPLLTFPLRRRRRTRSTRRRACPCGGSRGRSSRSTSTSPLRSRISG